MKEVENTTFWTDRWYVYAIFIVILLAVKLTIAAITWKYEYVKSSRGKEGHAEMVEMESKEEQTSSKGNWCKHNI